MGRWSAGIAQTLLMQMAVWREWTHPGSTSHGVKSGKQSLKQLHLVTKLEF
jgi:hypothetical protein